MTLKAVICTAPSAASSNETTIPHSLGGALCVINATAPSVTMAPTTWRLVSVSFRTRYPPATANKGLHGSGGDRGTGSGTGVREGKACRRGWVGASSKGS